MPASTRAKHRLHEAKTDEAAGAAPCKRTKTGPQAAVATPGRATAPPRRKQTAMEASKAAAPPEREATQTLKVNRAPVLALWVAVVAERQGYSFEEGLTFGKWVSGTLAQSKGRRLGIYEKKERTEEERAARRRRDEGAGVRCVDAFGMHIPAIQVDGQWRAVSEGKPASPDAARGYLERAFGANGLAAARAAMEHLAAAVPQDEAGGTGYKLYERFRPEWHGWGQKGTLDLAGVRSLATSWRDA